MCIKTIENHHFCSCVTVRYLICTDLVEERRKQLHNLPCPKAELREIATQEGGCKRRNLKVPCVTVDVYSFEHWGAEKGPKKKFLEPEYLPGPHECEDGMFWRGPVHSCGVGKGEGQWWKHIRVVKPQQKQDGEVGAGDKNEDGKTVDEEVVEDADNKATEEFDVDMEM